MVFKLGTPVSMCAPSCLIFKTVPMPLSHWSINSESFTVKKTVSYKGMVNNCLNMHWSGSQRSSMHHEIVHFWLVVICRTNCPKEGCFFTYYLAHYFLSRVSCSCPAALYQKAPLSSRYIYVVLLSCGQTIQNVWPWCRYWQFSIACSASLHNKSGCCWHCCCITLWSWWVILFCFVSPAYT